MPLLLNLANRVTHLPDRLALNAREEARKGGISGTSCFVPLRGCWPAKTWYPKPIAAIKVPVRPLLQLSGTRNQVTGQLSNR